MIFQVKSMDFEQNLHPKSLILTEYHRKIMNSHVLIDKNGQNRPKTIKNRKNTSWNIFRVFSIFLVKLHFSHISQHFWHRSLSAFSRFRQIGHAVHPTVLHQCVDEICTLTKSCFNVCNLLKNDFLVLKSKIPQD